MSLESFHDRSDQYPHVVTRFNSVPEVCNCNSSNMYAKSCGAIYFDEVANVVLKGINVTVYTPNISGIVFWNVSSITVQSTTVYSISSNTCAYGILLVQVESFQANSVGAYSFKTGLFMRGAGNVSITNITTRYNNGHGIYLNKINNIQITNTTAIYNNGHGMHLNEINNIQITNTTTTHNVQRGIFIYEVINVSLKRTTAMFNGGHGIYLHVITNINISITVTAHNNLSGMVLWNTSNTYIVETTAIYNNVHGIYLRTVNNIQITNTTTTHNVQWGIILYEVINVSLKRTTAMFNGWDGIYLAGVTKSNISITMTAHNNIAGMFLIKTNNTYIVETTAIYNNIDGIYLGTVNNIQITNTTTTHNVRCGIILYEVINVSLKRTTAMFNRVDGIYLYGVTNSNIHITMTAHNNRSGVLLWNTSNTYIVETTAIYNRGSGIFVFKSRHINIMNASIHNNNGSTIYSDEYFLKLGYLFNPNEQILVVSCTEIIIDNSSFVDINAQRSASTTNPSTLPAIIGVSSSTLEISECSFKQNHISAVRAFRSNVTLSGNVLFSNNTAVFGTAFVLVQGSVIRLVRNTNIIFKNNYATNAGGVFYIGLNDYSYLGDASSHRTCFLNTPVDRSQIQFTFVNNSAGLGGDILYGGQVAFALDGDWNCLESFENISTITAYQNDFSSISSKPSRVCFCNESRIPDCMIFSYTKTHSFYPGQNMYISAVTVGQNFGTVPGSVYAQYFKRSHTDNLLELDGSQKVQSVTQKSCNKLFYTLFSPKDITNLILVLTVEETVVSSEYNQIFSNQTKSLFQQSYHTSRFQPLLYSNNPVYVNISILPCPVGFMLTSDPPFKCDCNQLLQQIPGVHCNIQHQTVRRSGLVWVGMVSNDNTTVGTIAASQYCPLNYCNSVDCNVYLTKSDIQCSYNHSGILCGACQPGLSLALGSERCLLCSNKYLALLIPFTLAGPVLVGFIKVLDLTVSQGTMNGLIFYVNVIQANRYTFLPWSSTHVLSVFIAWLNLDLGVETCFFKELDAYYKTWLQFIFPFYIWSIAGLIIFSKYSIRVSKLMGNNSVPVLATLFLLSHAKLFRIIISALSYTILYTSEGHKAVWSADGNVDYLSPKHMVLFVVAVVFLLFLWLPYTLVLFLAQWLHMCNCQLIVRFLFKIKPFLDAHYAPLRDKHRYWFGILHLVRAAILLVSSLIPADHSSIVTINILASSAVLMFFGSIVYNKTVVAMFNMGFFLNLTLMTGATCFSHTIGGDSRVYVYLLTGLALLQFVGLLIFKIYSILKNISKCRACTQVCIRQHVEDDWEVFEQAALLRERESESEEEGSESSGSMETLPTY